MAVPQAVLKQREKLAAELGVNADGSPLVTTPAAPELTVVPSTPASPEVPATPTEPVVTPDARDARIAELEHLLKTRDGQTSASMREVNEAKQRADVLASQVAALEQGLEELRKQKETVEAQVAAKHADATMPGFEVEELTAEELEKFQPDSISFVNKATKKQLVSYIKPLVDKISALEKVVERVRELDQLPQLAKTVKDAETESQRVREEEFFRKEVLAHFSDFETVRDTQPWKDYLAEDIPGRGIKIVNLLNQYRLIHNAQGIRSLIQAYYDQNKAKPTLADLATPRGTQTEGSPVVKPRMKASEYKAKLKLFLGRRLAKADWDAFKSEFEAARLDDRIDMDERL